ncbi:PREDICTED: E3 ubiquitin-protein ligase RNF128 [Cariama cristata]|uniref:E3 ubiquitin-protein ligase RNF128 n=1 Tax=Cariama cristata TaxID=54380 RepID=UPI0005204BB6|nr:PREDICTED: E3 ubiquitin-protein ligase RNF128 [Cariama cristata]
MKELSSCEKLLLPQQQETLTSNQTVSEHCECGLYGLNSPLLSVWGLVAIPTSDRQACNANTQFSITKPPWIALVKRGNCSFAQKIRMATRRGAAAAVIYNMLGKGHNAIPMSHRAAKPVPAAFPVSGGGRSRPKAPARWEQGSLIPEVSGGEWNGMEWNAG